MVTVGGIPSADSTRFGRPAPSSTSTTGTSASGPRKSRPHGATLEVGGYVSVSGKTKPAMLQMDNDDGTWDVEYLGGEEAKVKESQMKRVLGSQQRQIDQAKAAEKHAKVARKEARKQRRKL